MSSLEPAEDGYRLRTQSGVYESAWVIVATGAYQRPYLPPISEQLSAEVTQLHSAEYRNPAQLTGDRVLVVGAANSGAQIAEDLAQSHQVQLSQGGRIPRLPRRVLGKSVHWYGDRLGLIAASLDSLRGRTQRGDTLIGTSLRQLERHHGVELVDRTVDARERTVTLENGRELEVQAVVWATGYRPDYSWIHAPVLDPHGRPIHRRGVTQSPGALLPRHEKPILPRLRTDPLGQARRRIHRRPTPRHRRDSHRRHPPAARPRLRHCRPTVTITSKHADRPPEVAEAMGTSLEAIRAVILT